MPAFREITARLIVRKAVSPSHNTGSRGFWRQRRTIPVMIILLSDLHLTDCAPRSTADVARLINQLFELTLEAQKKRVEKLTVVLLGDIFEVLKSMQWLVNDIRPWEPSTDVHVGVVAGILDSILASNQAFFDGLTQLTKEYGFVSLAYVPGNHDRPLNTEMGRAARVKLQETLPLSYIGGEVFDEIFIDDGHSVIAKHGHEWDPTNRYLSGYSALGDAIVIELLVGLPGLVSHKMGVDTNDPMLTFLHEIDNVQPQTPRAMALWIIRAVFHLRGRHPDIGKIIQEALEEIIQRLRLLRAKIKFEAFATAKWWIAFLTFLLDTVVKELGPLPSALTIPAGGHETSAARDFALRDLQAAEMAGGTYRYIVSGHTHLPELVPLDLVRDREPARLYLNTGTWRRVHRIVGGSHRKETVASFETWQVESLVCLHSFEERKRGYSPYELHCVKRGAPQ